MSTEADPAKSDPADVPADVPDDVPVTSPVTAQETAHDGGGGRERASRGHATHAAHAAHDPGGQPYGLPGKPLARGPFLFGLVGGLGVLTAIALAQMVVYSLSTIILIVVAMFLAVGLNPAVEALQRRGLARRGAISIVFAGVIVAFVLFGLAVVPPVSQQLTEFIEAVPGYITDLSNHPTLRQLDAEYQVLQQLRTFVTATLGPALASGIMGAGLVVLNGVFTTVTLLVLMLYFLGSLHTIKEYLLKLVPASRRARTGAISEQILSGIGGYVAGNVLISVVAGVVTWIFLSVMGVRYALALALVVALTDFIPLVGATIGAVLVTSVALLQSLPAGIACAVFFLLYQQIENYLIYPRVMKRSVNVAPAVTVIAALFGGALLGIVGALLAIPVAAAIALIVREVVVPRQERA
ncbi:AI-2E family transporter [Nonomuraea jiangxiensis]|uniref:Predicted PurR-regulated permease PerM n=1 Tax=Nonomuraea jiangxiensis TaxID=633440 RepID=A0A1G8V660_9ACTN|nr:AI-2E family transporter [Nonomuraea jiangxiensis]SDJ61531.1 Predicted PurR-regulated permease PerM [Nonomuraea jiangxiensis]